MRPSGTYVGIALTSLYFVLLTGQVASSTAEPEPPLETLIDQLTEVAEPGYGYSTLSGWNVFLPYPESEQVEVLVLGGPKPSRSEPLEQIVRRGAAAVPALLRHLDDARPTKLPPIEGFDFVVPIDRPDRNVRMHGPAARARDEFNFSGPESHQVTVGDLCYVAVGQITNRSFDASRYVPSGGVAIGSPTYSKLLREAVQGDFNGFTAEKHKRLLREDFEKPDDDFRRIGAYLRLCFYYPEEVEPLVLKQLAVPTFDVFAAETFVQETLYKEPSPERQQALLTQFVAEYGAASRDGVLLQLFGDLDLQEADEEGRLSPPLEEKRGPKGLLVRLYGYPKSVMSTDKPYVDTWAETERDWFIGALTHDDSRKIDEVVLTEFRGTDDEYTRHACVARLKGKGYPDVDAYLREKDEREKELQEMEERGASELQLEQPDPSQK